MLTDYLSLMKLRIAALLLLVALAGFIATSGRAIDWMAFGSLLLAGFLASTGSSAVNSYIDRDIDRVMDRTRHRPLPTERIQPPEKALAFGAVLIALSLVAAWFLNNPFTAGFIGLGIVTYLGVYTIGLKRSHESNIVIGGFAGSCPALAGSAAASGGLSLAALLIALLVFLWTPGHFWALAYRQREDYRRAGLPMLPAVRDEATAVRAITASSILVAVVAIAFAPTEAFGFAYLIVAIAAAAGLVYVTWRFFARPNADTAWAGYKYSSAYLGALLIGIVIDAILPFSL